MMLFASPTSPLVQPRSVIGGHLIAVPAAIALDYLVADQYLGFFPQVLAVPLLASYLQENRASFLLVGMVMVMM
eukprot:3195059-Rhodomonas_salina.1